MRVAMTGPSGCGKSTLAEHVSKTFDIPINPVGSRSVAKAMGFDNPYDVDAAGKRREFQQRLLGEKIAWEQAHDSFVTDRTTCDNLAYSILHDPRGVDEAYVEDACDHANTYDTIVFCPIASFCVLGGDPARVNDINYQRVYEIVLRGCLAHAFGDDLEKMVFELYSNGDDQLEMRKHFVIECVKGGT